MKGLIPFIRENGAGLGTLTIYTGLVLFYFFVLPNDSNYIKFILLFSFAPAIFVYEASKELTTPFIKNTLEQHVAITRVKLELEHGGEFDDWYDESTEEKIDNLDSKAQNKVITILCSATIGLTAPIFGYLSFDILGLVAGVVILGGAIWISLRAMKRVKKAISRTTKVVKS